MRIYALATFSDVMCTENMEVEEFCHDHDDAMLQFNDLLDQSNWADYVAEKIDEFTIKQTLKDTVYFWAIVVANVDVEEFIPVQRS